MHFQATPCLSTGSAALRGVALFYWLFTVPSVRGALALFYRLFGRIQSTGIGTSHSLCWHTYLCVSAGVVSRAHGLSWGSVSRLWRVLLVFGGLWRCCLGS